MNLANRPRIGVMGPSECAAEILDLARETGRIIARRGAILVCGGGCGVMDAAAEGAKSEGGLTIGILPGASAAEANPHIDLPIVTDMGNARNVINVLTSQAVIAIAGGPGTLSEIALALKCRVPVVALRSWSIVAPGGGVPEGYIAVSSPEEAVDTALGLAR